MTSLSDNIGTLIKYCLNIVPSIIRPIEIVTLLQKFLANNTLMQSLKIIADNQRIDNHNAKFKNLKKNVPCIVIATKSIYDVCAVNG